MDDDLHLARPLSARGQGRLDPSVGADIAAGKRPTKMKEDEAIIYDLLTEMYRDHEHLERDLRQGARKYGERESPIFRRLRLTTASPRWLSSPRARKLRRRRTQAERLAQVFPEVCVSVVSSWPRLANDWICETRCSLAPY